MPKVWYNLDDKLDMVTIPEGCLVAELTEAIKKKWGERISCAAPEIELFECLGAAEPLPPYFPVQGTTPENALIVVLPMTNEREKDLLSKRKEGKLYSSINQVWLPYPQPFAGSFEGLCRPEGYSGVPFYTNLVQEATELSTKKSESKANTESQENLDVDLFGNGPASRAHLIPADKLCSATYGILALAVVGAFHFLRAYDKRKAILALRFLIYGSKEGENAAWGLKNLPSNFVVLPNPHKEHFDASGEWMLFPIFRTLGDMKRWEEDDEYWALAMAGSTNGGGSTANKNSEIYRRLLRGSDYKEKPFLEKCSEQDILDATNLLARFVKGVADVLDREGPEGPSSQIAPSDLLTGKRDSTDAVQDKKDFMVNSKKELLIDGNVAVPTLAKRDLSKFNLMKVLIRKLEGVDGVTDPMLLAFKAAIQWSQRQSKDGFKLHPACGKPDPEEDPADQRAREAYREMSMRSSFDPRFASLQMDDDPSPMLTRFRSSPPGGEPIFGGPQRVTLSPTQPASGKCSPASSVEGDYGDD